MKGKLASRGAASSHAAGIRDVRRRSHGAGGLHAARGSQEGQAEGSGEGTRSQGGWWVVGGNTGGGGGAQCQFCRLAGEYNIM